MNAMHDTAEDRTMDDLEINDNDIRIDHIPSISECRELLAMFKVQGYYPEVFHVNDHGNVDLLEE